MKTDFPSRRQAAICVAALLMWLAVTAAFVGFRPEHPVMALLIFALFFANGATRRLTVALAPFFIFGISYDWMNIVPNYTVNPADVTGRRGPYLHFALVFLLVNLLGFAGYYIHPAAPPWYVAGHGFEAVVGTRGEVAGLGAFDAMTGLGIFDGLYARNSNVFAALPSLHSAYTLVAFIYAMRSGSSSAWKVVLAVVTLGIWFTAVYTSHHYIIDVLAGIGTALAGFLLFEYVLMKIPPFAAWIARYARYISTSN